MKTKIFLFACLSLFLSSCCWLVHDDCIEESQSFVMPVSINYTDTVINANDPLSITIESAAFLNTYNDMKLNQSSFSVTVTWFDGNFTSGANHTVEVLSSNLSGFSTQEYNGYSGPLPQNIEFELGFTIPGYYLVQFNGSASGSRETKQRRCNSCGDYSYFSFQFESNRINSQYFNLYRSSSAYSTSLADLQYNGSYFIKVE